MKNLYFVFLFLLSLSVFSCDKETTTGKQVNNEMAEESKPNSDSQAQTTSYENGTEGRTQEGYRYIHHINNNTEKPVVGDQVTYHKMVFKNDTTLLQSTYYLLEPRSDVLIPRDSVPQPPHPTYDALFLMSPGDSMTIFQELDTFPKDFLPEGITNEDRFTYNLKVISFKRKAIIEKEIAAVKARHISVADSLRAFIKTYESGQLKDKMITTESGLQYFMNKEGTGKQVKDGGFVKVHYLGMLKDGAIFDSSFPSAKPYPTRIGRGQVIAGWDEGIPLLKEGGEATFVVPYTLAYGIAGKPPGIPQKADLYFYVRLVGVY